MGRLRTPRAWEQNRFNEAMNLKSDVAIERDAEFMRHPIRLARRAFKRGDTLVGSAVVCDGGNAGEGIEAVRSEKDLAAHAGLRAVQQACRALGSLHLDGCTLYDR